MLRTALLSLILIVSLSSSSTSLRKAISRRQTDPQYCHAIEGFDCKCSYYRATCTTDRDLPSSIIVVPNEKNKYQSVELVIAAARDIHVNDHTFEPVKELYKSDGDNFEFRIKFEKFTALHLSSPGILNRVFPENLPSSARKHLALEIYNPEVPPHDNVNLFQNLNADSLELYGLYPFHGTFQQLFHGANIKYLRLSGGDIRPDLSQPFTGNIARLELAKQASELSVQNFPVYPAHELIINAYYVKEFNHEHPPNYNNLAELRVHSQERIPANAFRQFPNLRILSISTEQDIDPHALNGLNNLEKLTIKDTKTSLDLLNSVSNVKEFETNIEKLDENTQCMLIEKLANGQLAIQAIPNGRECTCVSAYLDTATGRPPCDAQHCEHSTCAAIKNNYDTSTRTFKAPPPIRRSDGTDALRQREPRVYTVPFQVAHQDNEKLQNANPQQAQQPQTEDDPRRPTGDEQGQWQPQQPNDRPDTYPHWDPSNTVPHFTKSPYDGDSDSDDHSQHGENHQHDESNFGVPQGEENDQNKAPNSDDVNVDNNLDNDDSKNDSKSTPTLSELDSDRETTTITLPSDDDTQGGQDQDGGNRDNAGVAAGPTEGEGHHHEGEGHEHQPPKDGNENQPDGDGTLPGVQGGVEGAATNGTEEAVPPPKRGMSWIPIIIIAAAIGGILLIGLIVLFIKKRKPNKGYTPTPGNEPQPAARA